MKKGTILGGIIICTLGILTGCSSTQKTADATGDQDTHVAADADATADASNDQGTNAVSSYDAYVPGAYDAYVTLGEYKGIDLLMIKTEVTQDMIDDEISMLQEDEAEYTDITDRAAQAGDTVNIDFEGTIDGEELEDGSYEDYELIIGDGDLLEDLESGLIGMRTGDTKDITVTFPDDYDEELGGKTAVFNVTLNDIYEVSMPEYNDEFVASVTDGEYTNTKEFEEYLEKQLYAALEYENRYTAGVDAADIVLQNTTFTGYPQELYDAAKEEYDSTNELYAEMFGIDVSELESDEEETRLAVEEIVYSQMLIQVIAEKENLKLTDEEYQQFLKNNYELYGYSSTEEFEEYEEADALMSEALTEMVYNFLIENANVTEVTEDEYMEMFEE